MKFEVRSRRAEESAGRRRLKAKAAKRESVRGNFCEENAYIRGHAYIKDRANGRGRNRGGRAGTNFSTRLSPRLR